VILGSYWDCARKGQSGGLPPLCAAGQLQANGPVALNKSAYAGLAEALMRSNRLAAGRRDWNDRKSQDYRNRHNKRETGPKTTAKVPTGIPGLDEITGGGLPRGRPTLLCGNAGCGKTVLAMEFLVRGAEEFGEPGVLLAFEETTGDRLVWA
jgi:predicted ATP-dependent serine protease